MSSRVSRVDTGVGVSFIASAVIHLAVFLLLVWWGQLYPPQIAIQETYYVDIVSLPVADPQSGSSMQNPGEAEAPPPFTPPPSDCTEKDSQRDAKRFGKTCQAVRNTTNC